MSDARHYTELLHRYLSGTAGSDEEQTLFALTRTGQYDEELNTAAQHLTIRSVEAGGSFEGKEALFEQIQQNIAKASKDDKQASPRRPGSRRRAFSWLLVALLSLGAGYWYWQLPAMLHPGSRAVYSGPHPMGFSLTSASQAQLQQGTLPGLFSGSDGRQAPKIICVSLNSMYTNEGAEIVIDGAGCM